MIDADALIVWTDNYCVDEKFTVAHFANMVRDMPTVQPECKQGHWLINSDGYYPYCSECRKEPKSGDMTDFCPSCGAYMGKGEPNANN